MKEVGTLKELGVKAGDVVEYVNGGSVYDVVVITPHTNHPRARYCNIGELFAISRDGNNHQSVSESLQPQWRVVSRATPKLWRDMMPEEKGALLLAAHDGKVMQSHCDNNGWVTIYPSWDADLAYRIKPEPKVEVVTQHWKTNKKGEFVCMNQYDEPQDPTHRITFNLIDGKPDCASVKMECI